MEAEFVLGVCERFGCLPSQLLQEDASLLRLLAIEAFGKADIGSFKAPGGESELMRSIPMESLA